jgi:uncharacterized membrane protein
MKIDIEIDEKRLRELVVAEIQSRLGDIPLESKDVKIIVKTKQNYKAEWEAGEFKATYSKTI